MQPQYDKHDQRPESEKGKVTGVVDDCHGSLEHTRKMPPLPNRFALLVAAGALVCSCYAIAEDAKTTPPAPTCDTAEYRQFDFWIGTWSVTEGGQPAGHNTIESDLKHCALFESWSSVDGSRGRSINFYDRNRRHWHQSWIDDRGGALELEGGLIDGSMVLEGERPSPKAGSPVHDRITWTPQRDGSVRQHWESKKPGQPTWETVFDGIYKR